MIALARAEPFDAEVLAMRTACARLAAAESNPTVRDQPTTDSACHYSSIAMPSIKAVGCGRFAAGRSGSLVRWSVHVWAATGTPSMLHASRTLGQ